MQSHKKPNLNTNTGYWSEWRADTFSSQADRRRGSKVWCRKNRTTTVVLEVLIVTITVGTGDKGEGTDKGDERDRDHSLILIQEP